MLSGISNFALVPPISVFTHPGCKIRTDIPSSFQSIDKLLAAELRADFDER